MDRSLQKEGNTYSLSIASGMDMDGFFSDFQKGVMVCPCPYPRNEHGQIIKEGR